MTSGQKTITVLIGGGFLLGVSYLVYMLTAMLSWILLAGMCDALCGPMLVANLTPPLITALVFFGGIIILRSIIRDKGI